MKTIYKYTIPVTDDFTLKLPKGAKILTFQAQNDTPCIWAVVDDIAELETVHFKLLETGHPAGNIDPMKYIGTALIAGGALVWHLFMFK